MASPKNRLNFLRSILNNKYVKSVFFIFSFILLVLGVLTGLGLIGSVPFIGSFGLAAVKLMTDLLVTAGLPAAMGAMVTTIFLSAPLVLLSIKPVYQKILTPIGQMIKKLSLDLRTRITSTNFWKNTHPIKIKIAIHNNNTTAYLGQDKEYNFHEHITDESNKPFKVNPTDLYIELIDVNPKRASRESAEFLSATGMSGMLPSSLFKGKIEGDVVRYRWDGQPVELTLAQQNFPRLKGTFEIVFDSTRKNFESDLGKQRYFYTNDKPDNLVQIRFSDFNPAEAFEITHAQHLSQVDLEVYYKHITEGTALACEEKLPSQGLSSDTSSWFQEFAGTRSDVFEKDVGDFNIFNQYNASAGQNSSTRMLYCLSGFMLEPGNVKCIVQKDRLVLSGTYERKTGIQTNVPTTQFLDLRPSPGNQFLPDSTRLLFFKDRQQLCLKVEECSHQSNNHKTL